MFSIVEELESKTGLLSVKEVAQIFGLGIRKIYKMVDAKKIPALKFEGTTRFDPAALVTWIRRQHSAFGKQ